MADEMVVPQEQVTELDEFDAATRLDSLLAPEPKAEPKVTRDPETGKFVSTKPKAEPDEEPGPYADDEPTDPTKAKDEKPDAEDDKEADDDEPAAPPTRILKVKIDGIEQELPEDEVVKGYSRTADYTRKTQALAEERRKFEAEERAVVRQEREVYARNLQAVAEALESLTPSREPDWEAEAQRLSPEEFSRAFTQWKANTQRIERIREEQSRVLAKQQEDEQRDRAARVRAANERLAEKIPEWKDPEKGKVLKADLIDYARSIGFTDDDLSGIEDDKPLLILHKARLWDESQKRRSKVEERVDRLVEAIKPTTATPQPKAKKADAMRQQLKASGSEEDAAKLLDTIMSG